MMIPNYIKNYDKFFKIEKNLEVKNLEEFYYEFLPGNAKQYQKNKKNCIYLHEQGFSLIINFLFQVNDKYNDIKGGEFSKNQIKEFIQLIENFLAYYQSTGKFNFSTPIGIFRNTKYNRKQQDEMNLDKISKDIFLNFKNSKWYGNHDIGYTLYELIAQKSHQVQLMLQDLISWLKEKIEKYDFITIFYVGP